MLRVECFYNNTSSGTSIAITVPAITSGVERCGFHAGLYSCQGKGTLGTIWLPWQLYHPAFLPTSLHVQCRTGREMASKETL